MKVSFTGSALKRSSRVVGTRGRLLVSLVIAVALLASSSGSNLAWAETESTTDAGRSFEPAPTSRVEFGIKPPPAGCFPARNSSLAPEEECEGQKRFVVSGEHNIYVETYLPEALPEGSDVPQHLPTVLIMSPYTTFDRVQQVQRHDFWVSYFATRGYAVAIGHVLGTGSSDGCMDYGGPAEVDATAHVIDFLGNSAPWTNGKVGMLGLSYDASTQIGVAALGDPALTEPLKAIVPIAPVIGTYDVLAVDGVPTGTGIASEGAMVGISYLPGEAFSPGQVPGRSECSRSNLEAGLSADTEASVTPYFADRQYRRGVGRVRAATLLVQGLGDTTDFPNNVIGFFDQLPEDVPHKMMLGQWGHAWPDRHELRDELPRKPLERVDFPKMVQAWFDRFLMDSDTGVEEWPGVQVQDSNGQWRAEPDWPNIGGPFGQLALGLNSELGAVSPEGATSFSETPSLETPSKVSFATDPLDRELRISGQPVLDLTVRLRNPDGLGDAHIAASLHVFGPDGEQRAQVYGARSLQHLDPMPHGYFDQSEPKTAPLDTPVRVAVRLMPTDLVVPAGGHLELRVGGPSPVPGEWPVALIPSGARSQVEILHSCEHPSVLRFAMPRPDADLLNVREHHETRYDQGSLPSNPLQGPLAVDGGGLANAEVCGRDPSDPQAVVAGKVQSHIGFVGTTSAQATDNASLEAKLTAQDGSPLVNKEVEFSLGGQPVGRALTGEDGVASVEVGVEGPARTTQLTAGFAGDDATTSSSISSSFLVTQEDSALTLSHERRQGRTVLIARLTEQDIAAPLSGRIVRFFWDGAQIGSVVTGADGTAETVIKDKPRSSEIMSALFDGDDTYAGTSAVMAPSP